MQSRFHTEKDFNQWIQAASFFFLPAEHAVLDGFSLLSLLAGQAASGRNAWWPLHHDDGHLRVIQPVRVDYSMLQHDAAFVKHLAKSDWNLARITLTQIPMLPSILSATRI